MNNVARDMFFSSDLQDLIMEKNSDIILVAEKRMVT